MVPRSWSTATALGRTHMRWSLKQASAFSLPARTWTLWQEMQPVCWTGDPTESSGNVARRLRLRRWRWMLEWMQAFSAVSCWPRCSSRATCQLHPGDSHPTSSRSLVSQTAGASTTLRPFGEGRATGDHSGEEIDHRHQWAERSRDRVWPRRGKAQRDLSLGGYGKPSRRPPD